MLRLNLGKDYVTHMHGLAVYVNEGLSSAQDLGSIDKKLLSSLTDFGC